jgi:NADH dehydrogenase
VSGPKRYGLEVFEETRPGLSLVEAAPRILPASQEKLANAAREELESLDVH